MVSCTNDSYYVHESNPVANCRWIRWEEDRRQEFCKYEEVHQFCPETCGDCCEDDLNYVFENGNSTGIIVNCDWLLSNSDKSEERKLEYCNGFWYKGHTVRDMCPKSCDFCKIHVPPDMFDLQEPNPTNSLSEMPEKSSSESFLLLTIIVISCIVLLGGIAAYVTRERNISSKVVVLDDSTSVESAQSYTYDQEGKGDLTIFANETDHTKQEVLVVVESHQKILEREIGVNSTVDLPPTPIFTDTDMSEVVSTVCQSSEDAGGTTELLKNGEDRSLHVTFQDDNEGMKAFTFGHVDCYRCGGNMDRYSCSEEEYMFEEEEQVTYQQDIPRNINSDHASIMEGNGGDDLRENPNQKALNSDMEGCFKYGVHSVLHNKNGTKIDLNRITSSQSDDHSRYGSTITIQHGPLPLQQSISALTPGPNECE